MKPWLILGLCLSPGVIVALVAAGVYVYDRRRDRSACQRAAMLINREELERLRSSAAWVEAYMLQLNEIQALPEIEPWRRWCA